MDKHPTDKRKLKGWLNKEELTDYEKKNLIKLWDMLMMWSGVDGYYTVPEIAYNLGIGQKTVYSRINKFKKMFPDAYKRLKGDRETVKRVSARHGSSLRNPISWDALNPEFRDGWIREKF